MYYVSDYKIEKLAYNKGKKVLNLLRSKNCAFTEAKIDFLKTRIKYELGKPMGNKYAMFFVVAMDYVLLAHKYYPTYIDTHYFLRVLDGRL